MGGVDGRGAGGGSRELLPLTRFRLVVEFRDFRIPALAAFPVLYLLEWWRWIDGFSDVVFLSCYFLLLAVVSPPSFPHLLKVVLLSNWSYWASYLLLLCLRCTCQSHPSKAVRPLCLEWT